MSEGKGEIITHSISRQDFSRTPNNIKKYKKGEQITRDNFSDFLSKSFAVSGGGKVYQYIYFRWLEETTGFDWKKTLLNFREAGGLDKLSQIERETFAADFKRVFEAHYGEGTIAGIAFDKKPGDTVNRQLNALIGPEPGAKKEEIESFNTSISNFEDKYKKFKKMSGDKPPISELEFANNLASLKNKDKTEK